MIFEEKIHNKILSIICIIIFALLFLLVLDIDIISFYILITILSILVLLILSKKSHYILENDTLILKKSRTISISIKEILYIKIVNIPGIIMEKNKYYIITKNSKIIIDGSYLNKDNEDLCKVLCDYYNIKIKESNGLI